MKGSIKKSGRVYFAIIAVGNKRKWFRGGYTREEAEKVLIEKLGEINSGTYREIPKIGFSDFSELWLKNYAEIHVKPSTLEGYRNIIRNKLCPVFGNSLLSGIRNGQLQVYIADRLRCVSAKTVCNEIVVIKQMCKHALRWGYLKTNPSEYLDRPKLTKTEIDFLGLEEIERFLQHAQGHYYVAFLTAILTGLRAGELWGLRWTDIDWNTKRIYVRYALWKGKLQTPKSRYSVRKVDIPDMLVSKLKKWKLICPVNNEYDLVFPSPRGRPSCHDTLMKRYFLPVLRRAGLRQVSFHSLRHTNASMRIQAGQNIKYIQSQLGHSSISVTLDIYGHLFDDENFSQRQVELLMSTFESVRYPLGKSAILEVDTSYPLQGAGDQDRTCSAAGQKN